MTSTLHRHRRSSPALLRTVPCLDDIEAWIAEVQPVLDALRDRSGPPSLGQRRWLADQLEAAVEALEALECQALEADDADEPCDAVLWAHTRVSVLLGWVQALAGSSAAA
jgi:hypothetical protein